MTKQLPIVGNIHLLTYELVSVVPLKEVMKPLHIWKFGCGSIYFQACIYTNMCSEEDVQAE